MVTGRTRVVSWLALTSWLVGSGAGGAAQDLPHASFGVLPVTVETLDLAPTVVTTGDVITRTYRVRFPDLIADGKEILILEDRMVPESLPVHPFEGLSLDIRKSRVGDDHIFDFVYGFRLITPEKAVYVLPSFSFYYLVRDLGEEIEDAEVQQIEGGQGLVRYVATITDLPVLDIRDTVELGKFSGRVTLFRTIVWTVAPLPLVIWLFMLARLARRPKMVSIEAVKAAEELERLDAQIQAPPSIWAARGNLRRRLKALARIIPTHDNGAALRDLERALVISMREYLQAELPNLNPGDTAKEIMLHVEGLRDGARKDGLATLASRLVAYQSDLEKGAVASIEDPAEEVRKLDESLMLLQPHVRLWLGIKGWFRQG